MNGVQLYKRSTTAQRQEQVAGTTTQISEIQHVNQSEIGQVKYPRPIVSYVSTRNIAAHVKGRSRLRVQWQL